jgi:hypothetical protein
MQVTQPIAFDAAAQIVWGIGTILQREILRSSTMCTALPSGIRVGYGNTTTIYCEISTSGCIESYSLLVHMISLQHICGTETCTGVRILIYSVLLSHSNRMWVINVLYYEHR